jgi:hypothetical protein
VRSCGTDGGEASDPGPGEETPARRGIELHASYVPAEVDPPVPVQFVWKC